MAYERRPFVQPKHHNNALRARTSAAGPPRQGNLVVGDPARAAKAIKASKGARELAKKRGLDLSTIHGTGDGGSITVEDVRRQFGGI